MTDTTQLIISIQGKRGSGKSSLAAKVIEPVLKAIGAKLENKRDVEKGTFLTYALPLGLLAKAVQLYGQAQVDALVKEAVLESTPSGARRGVGFDNFDKVAALVAARREIETFAEGDSAGSVARMGLPPSLVKRLDPENTIKMIQADAAAALKDIDSQLRELGFNTKLPAR